MADPYSILGVSKGADEKAIKIAYRKLAKELHPDKNKDNPKASDRFSEVTQAYDLLSDAKKRGQYDRGEIDENGQPRFAGNPFGGGGGHSPGGPNGGNFDFGSGGIDLGDIFDGLFGGGGARPGGGPGPRPQQAPPPKGANIAYEHLVSFTDAATLAPQRILLGDGKTVEFKLPAGIVAGQQIRIPGRGQAGPGGNGDAMVTLKLGKHPDLVRDGDHIRIDLLISLKEAVVGGKVKVPTVDGAVMLTVPPRTNSGAVLRIKGRGFTAKTGARGDQLVTLMIHLPTDPAELERLSGVLSDSSVRENMGV
ncbi:DnaJ C-terminal domain-containing protein [Sphingorhabdus sp.]|jgi:DnaJ-class molecular chaperone|uniref:DnaJ C-terminal domain-containing protein n=1 Tax=Sphingorhabdus sp. TaxID=1902408 RepID=UPI0037C6DADD